MVGFLNPQFWFIFLLIFIYPKFYCVSQTKKSQTKKSQTNDKYHTKWYQEDNDNWRYFYDAGVEGGLFIPMDGAPGQGSGSVASLVGAYFFNDKWGVRSGLSLLTDLDGSDKYWKVPLLFSFRTRNLHANWDDNNEFDSFGEFLFNMILFVLPSRFELNVGPTLGYMTPEPGEYFTWHNDKLVLLESYDIKRRFAVSLDANIRPSFQIWRFCITGNLGVSYLPTQNYQIDYYSYDKEVYKPKWFASLGIGGAFRF